MKIQTIYEYLKRYGTKKDIDEILRKLNADELLLIRKRYGFDLEKPDPSCKLTNEESKLIYN